MYIGILALTRTNPTGVKAYYYIGHFSRFTIGFICKHAGIKAEVKNPYPSNEKRYKYINPHLFRHSFIRFLKDQGVKLQIIQKLARHSRIDQTLAYGEENMDDVQDAYNSVMEK